MNIEKFKLSIDRDILKVDKEGNLSGLGFPKNFSKENKFIRETDRKCMWRIRTPKETSVRKAYEKFEEITNVVTEELYNREEIIWPACMYNENGEKIKLYARVKFGFGEEYMPDQTEETYEKIENFIEENREEIEKIYGKITVNYTDNSIIIGNIRIQGDCRLGISAERVLMLVTIFFAGAFDIREKSFIKSLEKANDKYNLKAEETLKAIKEMPELVCNKSFKDILKLANKYMYEGYMKRYTIVGHEKLVAESKVLIKDSIAQGINYNVLNDNKSVVEHGNKKEKEIVIEGNKTDRDSYIFPIITDDKFIAKNIMKDAGLNVPECIILDKTMNEKDIDELVSPYYNSKIVVKPRNTNYGTGITVFSKPATKKQILDAIDYAFKFDDSILLEEYCKGMEYRFLVVNGKCVSIAHRRIASVVGDGKSTITELIKAKNKEPWHDLTGCPVKSDKPVEEYLKLQKLTFDSVIPKDKRVFLRTNSNCSTGGESVDYTDIIPAKFKRIAEKASRAFEAKICGVDIIIDDLEKDEYSIIEINDNPGYSINEWPYEGKGEKIGVKILQLLDLVEK